MRALAVLALLLAGPTVVCGAEREFYSGYAGSLPTDPRLLARTYFDDRHVRSLIFEMETGPVSEQRVATALAGSDVTVADLTRVGLIRRRQGRFALAFNYFNARDMEAVIGAANRYVPSLVAAHLARRKDFEHLLDAYPVATVGKDRLAFVLIAGFALNWDGLKLTQEMGLRRTVQVEGKGFHYSFWASEDVPSHDTHGFYWGSSTLPDGPYNYARDPADYAFSSFGDPFSDPRMSFPDLLLISAADMEPRVRAAAGRIGLVHDTSFGGDFKDVLGFESGRDFAAVLFALRQGPKGAKELGPLVREPEKIAAILGLLEDIQYVSRDEAGTFHLLVPVLDRADGPLLEKVLALSREILASWLRRISPELRRDLGTLTAMRQGVPFESLFTQIWHELFGLATKELVRSGFLFDPGGRDVRYKGSYPTLWRHSLYDLDLR
jgi:hypothetical protein